VYTGMNFKYFASTGDHLHGITRDLSTVNTIINALGLFFYFLRGNYKMATLCFAICMLTTSNVANLVLFSVLACVVFFEPLKVRKALAICFISGMVMFMAKVSPSNLNYLNNKVAAIFKTEKPIKKVWEDNTEKDNLITMYVSQNKRRYAGAEDIPSSLPYSPEAEKMLERQHKQDSIYFQEEQNYRNRFADIFLHYFGDTVASLNKGYYDSKPGKYLSFTETIRFAQRDGKTLIAGAGPGNFSSKLAFKASNIDIAGRYIEKYKYVSPDFRDNHFKMTLRYYMAPVSEHSVINYPNSVFNQLLGEYGLIGVCLFLVLYLWRFVKHFRLLRAGRYLLPVCLMFLVTDYWFESLSVLIVFELMMYLEMNEGSKQQVKS
jgi:hypothetical protein